jgi:hypothetical protein
MSDNAFRSAVVRCAPWLAQCSWPHATRSSAPRRRRNVNLSSLPRCVVDVRLSRMRRRHATLPPRSVRYDVAHRVRGGCRRALYDSTMYFAQRCECKLAHHYAAGCPINGCAANETGMGIHLHKYLSKSSRQRHQRYLSGYLNPYLSRYRVCNCDHCQMPRRAHSAVGGMRRNSSARPEGDMVPNGWPDSHRPKPLTSGQGTAAHGVRRRMLGRPHHGWPSRVKHRATWSGPHNALR